MPLIKTVQPGEAEGKIKEMYDMMSAMGGIPKPMQMMSASPKWFEVWAQTITYYFNHPTLSAPLLAHIRFLTALNCLYPYCIEFNKRIMADMLGLSEEQVKAVMDDPGNAQLKAKDKGMLAFVMKSIRVPEDVEQGDVDAVRELGWSDSDIFDAVNHGAAMVQGGIMFNAFKMGI